MTGGEKRESRITRCPACRQYYRIAAGPPAPGTRLRCGKCGEIFSPPATTVDAGTAAAAPTPVASGSGRGRVLVSTDGAEFQSLIGEVLSSAGFSLRQARSGEEAWAAIGSWRPHVALLDVALPGVPAFELCDRVRADKGLRGTGLILIASVFQQTRYKRAPTSLYGADDYIEKHHIRDRLPDKVARLIPAGAVSAAPAPAVSAAVTELDPANPLAPPLAKGERGGFVSRESQTSSLGRGPSPGGGGSTENSHGGIDEREQEALIREELYGSRGRERKGLERLKECLRRYARIIISDIALYNQELVEQGLREGTFSELLKKEIEEGYRLYLVRVPSSSGGEDYYHEAVRAFIARRTVGLRSLAGEAPAP